MKEIFNIEIARVPDTTLSEEDKAKIDTMDTSELAAAFQSSKPGSAEARYLLSELEIRNRKLKRKLVHLNLFWQDDPDKALVDLADKAQDSANYANTKRVLRLTFWGEKFNLGS